MIEYLPFYGGLILWLAFRHIGTFSQAPTSAVKQITSVCVTGKFSGLFLRSPALYDLMDLFYVLFAHLNISASVTAFRCILEANFSPTTFYAVMI